MKGEVKMIRIFVYIIPSQMPHSAVVQALVIGASKVQGFWGCVGFDGMVWDWKVVSKLYCKIKHVLELTVLYYLKLVFHSLMIKSINTYSSE